MGVDVLSQNFELLKAKNERLNVDLGEPYMFIINSAIEKGYAGNKSEVIRHALKAFEREMNANEESILVKKDAVDVTAKIKSGEIKTRPYSETKKKYNIK
jgi:Arc/MetJ-type ribon-helix-helix transcriptional regulator